MDSGLTFAQTYNLRPGIALTAEQLAVLTTDIVWLQQETVNLPDGTQTVALVPHVYAAVRAGDLNAQGGLLSGNTVAINSTGEVRNGGTILGRTLLEINANTINHLGGQIAANDVKLTARDDPSTGSGGTINITGASVTAQNSLRAEAGSYAAAGGINNARLSAAGNQSVTAERNQSIALSNDPSLANQTLWDSFKEFALPQAAGYAGGAVLGKFLSEAQAVYAAIKAEANAVGTTAATKLPVATDATATSPYSSSGTSYGKTTLKDVNGSPIATQPTLPGVNGAVSLSSTEALALRTAGLTDTEIAQHMKLNGDIYLFRGTSTGWAGSPGSQATAVSASIDPYAATVFALEARAQGGQAVVQYGGKSQIGTFAEGNWMAAQEREVGVQMNAQQFAQVVPNTVSADTARKVLADMGFPPLPYSVATSTQRAILLDTAPKMTPAQVAEFLRRVAGK